MARPRQRQRRRWRLAAGSALLAGALAATPVAGFVVSPPRLTASQHSHALVQGREGLASTGTRPLLAGSRPERRRAGRRPPRTARRIFDTGSFFGVGLPEATVIALLGWFLLGPEELFRLAKQVGNYIGELRTFVGQAARQYESALDDDSTKKAIEGIRQTQRTVSQISDSWRSVTDSLRNPLALGSSLDSAYSKLTEEREARVKTNKDKADEPAKAESSEPAAAKPPPELKLEGEMEEVATKEGIESKELGPVSAAAGEEETPEELERKREASKQAVADLWFTKAPETEEEWSPERAEAYVRRLDERLSELDGLVLQLGELRTGIQEDRQGLQELLQARAKLEEASPAAEQPTEVPVNAAPAAPAAAEQPEKVSAAVPAEVPAK